MWIILNFGPTGYVTDISLSFGSYIGKAIVPLFQPVGLGYWPVSYTHLDVYKRQSLCFKIFIIDFFNHYSVNYKRNDRNGHENIKYRLRFSDISVIQIGSTI